MPYDEALGDALALTEAQLAGGLHPVEDGLRIIEAQRGVAAARAARTSPRTGVGGFAQMTLVGHDHIEDAGDAAVARSVGERLGMACVELGYTPFAATGAPERPRPG